MDYMPNVGYSMDYAPTMGQPSPGGTQGGPTMPPSYGYGAYMNQPGYAPQTPPNPMVSQQAPKQNERMLLGRFISDISEVKPVEIPMDGTTAFFPTKDYKKIYAKTWGTDGKLYTFCFLPQESEAEQKEAEQSNFEKIFARLDDIEAKLDGRTAPKTKKEDK